MKKKFILVEKLYTILATIPLQYCPRRDNTFKQDSTRLFHIRHLTTIWHETLRNRKILGTTLTQLCENCTQLYKTLQNQTHTQFYTMLEGFDEFVHSWKKLCKVLVQSGKAKSLLILCSLFRAVSSCIKLCIAFVVEYMVQTNGICIRFVKTCKCRQVL